MESTTNRQHDHTMHRLALGGALLAGAIILSPYVLPLVGIRDTDTAEEILNGLCNNEGNGIAGGFNNLLKATPLVGDYITDGGYSTALATGGIGIGGMILGKRIEKNHSGNGINWGKVIKTAALATSLLIALPSVITGISMGLIFCSTVMSEMMNDYSITTKTIDVIKPSLGSIGRTAANNSGLSGGLALIPHLITCGASFFPAAASYFMAEDDDTPARTTNLAPVIAPTPLIPKPQLMSSSITQEGITARITTLGTPLAGMPMRATITLTHAEDGRPLSAEEIAVTHTEKLHLMLIDSSMKDYQHIHPQPTTQAGVFNFDYIPQTNNPVTAWADFTFGRDGKNPHIRLDMPSSMSTAPSTPPQIIFNNRAISEGLVFDWRTEKPLRQGEAGMVELTVTDKSGQPITDLEPVMGAYCHLVGFSTDGKDFIHSHPLGKEPQTSEERGAGKLLFHVAPERAGAIQFFAQIKHHGEMIFVPFGQEVAPKLVQAEKSPPTTLISHAHPPAHMIQQQHTHLGTAQR